MLARRFIFTAIVLFVVGIFLGIYMGASHDFRFVHVHAHINLLGWVALGLIGLIHAAYPSLERSWLARAHYWLHTVGLVLFMGGFAWRSGTGDTTLLPIAAGSTMVALGVLLFAFNAFAHLRAPSAREAA